MNTQIADFGMSRDLQDENYYVSSGGQVPVKWTAPEVSPGASEKTHHSTELFLVLKDFVFLNTRCSNIIILVGCFE